MSCSRETRCVSNFFRGCSIGRNTGVLSLTYNANDFATRFSELNCSIANTSVDYRVLSFTRGGYDNGTDFIYTSVHSFTFSRPFSTYIYYLSSVGRLSDVGSITGAFGYICGSLEPKNIFIFSMGALCGRRGILNSGAFIFSRSRFFLS